MTSRLSTFILDEVLERKRAEREKERLKLVERITKALDQLSRRIAFNEAYIFGSTAKPQRFLRDSDIDIGFVGLKDEDFFKAMAFLSSLLGRDVDVLQLEGHRMEEGSGKKESDGKREVSASPL